MLPQKAAEASSGLFMPSFSETNFVTAEFNASKVSELNTVITMNSREISPTSLGVKTLAIAM
jgi:hypothetical protein